MKNSRSDEDVLISLQGRYAAGVDEAGAGPLCGDLVVASVILNPDDPIVGLTDSKKISEKKREALFDEIMSRALDVCVVKITPQEIDRINIFQARMEGMRRCVTGLKKVDYVLIDGNKVPSGMTVLSDWAIKGDLRFAAVSAASIIAKVTRDRDIVSAAELYPQYELHKHKGYGTKIHLEMLSQFGPTPIHRMSYRPVKEAWDKMNKNGR